MIVAVSSFQYFHWNGPRYVKMERAVGPLVTIRALVGLQIIILACIFYGMLRLWKSVFPHQSEHQNHDPDPDLEKGGKGKTPFLRHYQASI